MALQNAFGDIALDASVQDVKTSTDAITTKLNAGIDITSSALPNGAATNAKLDQVITAVEGITPGGSAGGASEATAQEMTELISLMVLLLRQTRSLANIDTNKRQRVAVDVLPGVTIANGTVTTVTTVTGVTTVGSVTNQAQTAGYDMRQFRNQFRIAYNTAISTN